MLREPELTVKDLPASCLWYQRLFGGSIEQVDGLSTVLAEGRAVVRLRSTRELGAHPAPESQPALWIHVQDPEAVLRRALGLRAPIVVPPHVNPHSGWYEFVLSDPDGHQLAIALLN